MTTKSYPDRGRALLMSTAAASFVLSAALVAGPALASNECGTPSGGTVTCTSAGNPYATGISYAPTTDLTVVTDNTVAATGPVTVTGTTGANVAETNSGTISLGSTTASATGAIGVSSDTGNATITNYGAVSTAADSTPGLVASTGGAGNVSITSTGSVSTTGASSHGVFGLSTGSGNTSITVANVSATGTGTAGVLAESVGTGTTTVTVDQGATVTGGLDGVAMGATPNATVATTVLYNNGTINGGTNSVYTFAGSSGAVINNSSTGTINGPMALNGGVAGAVGNTVNNAGTWNASGASIFGPTGTTNVLNNTGTITTGPATSTPSTASFTNLTTFNNAGGRIDLTSGNSLNIGGATFNGGGTGATQSTLLVNANSANGELIADTTGTGSTRVVLADIPGTHPAMNLNGETLVTGSAAGLGPSAGTFNMGPGSMNQTAGFVDYRLAYAPATTGAPATYTLYGLPAMSVFEALNIPFALQDFWRHSAVAYTQRAMSIRDSQVGQTPSRPEGWEFWAQPYGNVDYFDRARTYTFGGFSFPAVGVHNDAIGLQLGADTLSRWNNGYGYWGFTAGLEQQMTHFAGDEANNLYALGGNFGMYGGANWGGFYANALGKVDFANMNTNFETANFSPTNTWKVYGTRGEVGYRWPMGGFFVEPSARINAIWTDAVDLFPAGAALRTNNDDPLVQGEAGGRLGTTINFGRFLPNMVNPFPGVFNAYVGAWYADQWSGQNNLLFTTYGGPSPTSIALAQPGTGSFIHMEYGLETADWFGGLKMFLKGENDFNGESVGGWGAQSGIRFSF